MRRALALLTVLVALAACNDPTTPTAPGTPTPDTPAPGAELEPDVAALLARARVERDAQPGAATWTHLAHVLHAHRMFREAAEAYDEAARLPGADGFACAYLAGVCLELRDADAALRKYEQALALRSDYVPLLLRAGLLRERLGDHAAARAAFERAEQVASSTQGRLGIARSWLAEGQPQKAYVLLQETPEAPGRKWFETLARAGYSVGREAEAREAAAAAERAGEAQPVEDPLLYEVQALGVSFTHRVARAQASFQSGDFARALAEVDQALAVRPDHPDALEVRAWTLARLQRADDAVAAFEAAVAAAPRDAAILTGLGRMLAAAGRPEEARGAYSRALDADPGRPEAILGLSGLCKRSDPAEARRLVVEVLRSDPTHRNAQRALADLLIAAGDFEKGTRYLEEAMSTSGDPARARAALENALR